MRLQVDGCSEVARGHCGVFVRYCGSKSRVTVAITLTLGSRRHLLASCAVSRSQRDARYETRFRALNSRSNDCRLMVDAVLGLKADAVTRTRAGSPTTSNDSSDLATLVRCLRAVETVSGEDDRACSGKPRTVRVF